MNSLEQALIHHLHVLHNRIAIMSKNCFNQSSGYGACKFFGIQTGEIIDIPQGKNAVDVVQNSTNLRDDRLDYFTKGADGFVIFHDIPDYSNSICEITLLFRKYIFVKHKLDNIKTHI